MHSLIDPPPAVAAAVAVDLDIARLLHFNLQVIDQALALVAAHEAPGSPAFAGTVGAHLRHIVEHYEALLFPTCSGEVDYDHRPRDRALERDTTLARARLMAIRQHVENAPRLDTPLRVHAKAGLAGELDVVVGASLGRELLFVASHAVHHFALLQAHCRQHGIATGADFGKAPATVAHERSQLVSNPA